MPGRMESGASCVTGGTAAGLQKKQQVHLLASPAGHSSPMEDLPLEQGSRERLWQQQGFAVTFLRKQKEVWKNNKPFSPPYTESWLRPC